MAPERAFPPEFEGRKLWLVDKPDRTQTQMLLMQESIRPEGERYAAAWVANEAFAGGGFGARLMQEVREKRGWSYGASANWSHLEQSSVYWLYVYPSTGDAINCLKLVYDLYALLQAEGISEAELQYARGSIVNSAAFYTDTPRKRLNYEVRKKLTGYDPLSHIETVEGLTLEQVNEAAKSVFDPQNLFGAIVATAKDIKAGLEELVGAENITIKAYDKD